MADLTDQIEAAGEAPRSVQADGVSVTGHSLAELIEADRYLKSAEAAASTKRGFNIAKFRPNGTE